MSETTYSLFQKGRQHLKRGMPAPKEWQESDLSIQLQSVGVVLRRSQERLVQRLRKEVQRLDREFSPDRPCCFDQAARWTSRATRTSRIFIAWVSTARAWLF